jgi:ribokinase
MGPRTVVVTLGSEGCSVAAEGFRGTVPALAVDVVDTTGAGDTFCGALAEALGEGRQLGPALRFAAAAAAISVTCMGAQPSIPERAEIESLLCGRGLGSAL